MKLESLQLDKFKNNGLEREQMFSLKGGLAVGTATPAGTVCGPHGPAGENVLYDYGYDSVRADGGLTFHDRSNIRACPTL